MAAPDRSVLEGKPVTELKEIAKSLDVKVSGLKKSEIIEAIANGGSKSSGSKPSAPKSSNGPAPKPREKAPQAPVETAVQTNAQTSSNGTPTDAPKQNQNPARDESAMDERDHRNDDRRQ